MQVCLKQIQVAVMYVLQKSQRVGVLVTESGKDHLCES